MTEQQRQRDHATIGDALIYTARGVGIGIALLAILAALIAGVWWWDKGSYRSIARSERAIVERQRTAITDLQSERDTCLGHARQLAHGLRVAKEMLSAEEWEALKTRAEVAQEQGRAPSGAELKALLPGPWTKYQDDPVVGVIPPPPPGFVTQPDTLPKPSE